MNTVKLPESVDYENGLSVLDLDNNLEYFAENDGFILVPVYKASGISTMNSEFVPKGCSFSVYYSEEENPTGFSSEYFVKFNYGLRQIYAGSYNDQHTIVGSEWEYVNNITGG